MARRLRRNHSPAFKAKVALAAAKGRKTLAERADVIVEMNYPRVWVFGSAGRHGPRDLRSPGRGQDNVRRYERYDINAPILDRGDPWWPAILARHFFIAITRIIWTKDLRD